MEHKFVKVNLNGYVELVPDYLGTPSPSYLGQGRFDGSRSCQDISEAIGKGNGYVSAVELRTKLAILPCVTLDDHPPLQAGAEREIERLLCEVKRLQHEIDRLHRDRHHHCKE